MFEKSLVDLIRGLRNHKGNEIEYIQSILKECRLEVKSQDMDVKAIALLKLVYLEMFGYDMSWASFNVLEVMSSAKYEQKRVGYLAAVQSFRPDTEVLMLATNLLKKDVTSPNIPVLSLPLHTLPHIITSSLALSLLSDLIPRLSHSHPGVRKKTVVTLYRLALVYPETLRVAWPKIKERLLDEQEDSSVTAAVVNVVCELGWRRPHDFLPLAPRLFDLLVDSGNNWMAIKIIKLFAVLTPLETRLIRKLLRPLTNIIQTTSAMSLLYECISGIIQGGILDGSSGSIEDDEVANLCVSKLRSMIVIEGDPNLKYVALLAFNKIVATYPILVSRHQDVIMSCLDDPDVSIRLQALELVSGMVTSDNLQSIVDRLLKQLQKSGRADARDIAPVIVPIEPHADSDEEDPEEKLKPDKRSMDAFEPVSDEYRDEVVHRILNICFQDTYSNITDFEWYIDILVKLVRCVPSRVPTKGDVALEGESGIHKPKSESAAARIGWQLRDISVRVKSLRPEATKAAESLILVNNRDILFPTVGVGGQDVLEPAVWVVGEFADCLAFPRDTLDSLLHDSCLAFPSQTLAAYVQAIPKVFSSVTATMTQWGSSQKTVTSLLLARIVDFLDKLATHPNLDVQERAVEFLELLRLATESLSNQAFEDSEAPLLLISAIPNLFNGLELNPVAPGAQQKVPLPEGIDLDLPINPNLPTLLQRAMIDIDQQTDGNEYSRWYHERPAPVPRAVTAAAKLAAADPEPVSYQDLPPEDSETKTRRLAERQDRLKDDPFYIAQDNYSSGAASPFHQVLRSSNGEDMDLDSIPIVDLHLDRDELQQPSLPQESQSRAKKPKKVVKRFSIAADENIEDDESANSRSQSPGPLNITNTRLSRPKNNLLHVDSSGLQQLSLEGKDESSHRSMQFEIERREAEEREMAEAMKEVERLRLEMQRAADRVEAAGGEATVVRKKKKKAKTPLEEGAVLEGAVNTAERIPDAGTAVKKKKKKKKVKGDVGDESGGMKGDGELEAEEEDVVIKKKKKRKPKPEIATPNVSDQL
ncbi:MAG: hypothetical protein Q9227_009004 [Pyrenula ochraceoflavens]